MTKPPTLPPTPSWPEQGTSRRNVNMAPSKLPRRLAYLLLTLSLLYLFSKRIASPLSLSPSTLREHNIQPTSPQGPSSSWNLTHHLGGNGPWIPHHSGLGSTTDPLPAGCAVDQMHMLARHGERYPTKNAGARHLELLRRLQAQDVKASGSLAFLNNWTYFTDPKDPAFEELTGSGRREAERAGRVIGGRYGRLLGRGEDGEGERKRKRKVRFWSCESARDVETARWFGRGFFGEDWESGGKAELEIIPEDVDREGDTLTPGDTCVRYIEDEAEGHDQGYGKLEAWQKVFTKPIAERLERDVEGVKLDHLDVYAMMEMCGFEILARGQSPWCEVFRQEEWEEFEYGRDLLHFYRAGPGNKYARVMGLLYLKATAELLKQEKARNVYLSFVHDGDIVPLLAAIGVLDEEEGKQDLPTDKMKAGRKWRTSDVVPMGGRVVVERIACGKGEEGDVRRYVRMSINDGVMEIPGLLAEAEVDHAVRVNDFGKLMAAKEREFGKFTEVCGLPSTGASRITFLHQ